MRHDYTVEGYGYRLRPALLDDARFILDLRTDPERNAFIHPTPNDVALQRRWIENYFERRGDYYFVIESKVAARSEGAIGLYGIDDTRLSGEWGRWIVRRRSLAAVESVALIYRFAFDVLGLATVYARTAAANVKAVSFHDSCGLERGAVLPGFLELNGRPVAAIERLPHPRALGAREARSGKNGGADG